MATRIQLRRDLSANWEGTNPILAQGEPGVELDTKKMKVGDGITTWNNLDYVAGGAEETSTTNMFVKIDALGGEGYANISGVVSVSTDGLNWTPSMYNQMQTDQEGWDIYHLAIGNGRIVYHTYEYASDVDSLRWAYNPFDKPNRPSSDAARMGPNGENVNWQNVRYVGDKFIAVGYYYDSVRNDDYNYPIAAYSTDGDVWTRINIDLDYCYTSLIDPEYNIDGNINGLMMTDVAYGDNGWLFVMHWGPYDATSGNENRANAFYVTDLATTLGSANYIRGIPGAYTVKYDGKGWVTWSDYDTLTGNSSILYINTSSDPRTGAWTETDMDTVGMRLTGVNVGNITDVVAGTVNGEHWMMIGTERHGAFATKDQGASWKFLQTGARSMNIYSISSTNPAYISSGWGYLTDNNGEKVTISGSNIPQANGTFYVNYTNGAQGWQSYLYTDYDPNTDTFSSPLDATVWGDTVEVQISAQVRNGFNTFTTGDTSNLRVGMVAEGYTGFTSLDNWNNNSYDPNVITAIDGDMVTMKYPWHENNQSNTTIYFRPVLYNTYGDGITSMAYGDGAFIGFSYSSVDRAYRTTDVANWTKTTRGNAAQYGFWGDNFLNSVAYGTVTTPASTLINNSETVPGYASYLTVGDTFTVSVTGGDPEWANNPLSEGYSTGGILIDPALSQWQIGVIQDVEGFDGTNYLGISSYRDNNTWYGNDRHDSIRVESSEGYNWSFSDTEGYFDTRNLNVEGANNMYLYTSFGEVTVNAPWNGYWNGNSYNGEGYAQLTWGDVVNKVRVDWYGTEINTEGYSWNFSNDYNDDEYGILYQPFSAGIQTEGYWWIGDYQNWNGGHSNTYIRATSWNNSYPTDLLFSAEGYDGSAAYVMNRYGTLEVIYGDGVFQSTGYWAIGDYTDNESYTYVGATDNVVDSNPYDIEIAADDTYFYFNRTGTFQLPPGGDIVNSTGQSVLNRDMIQTLQDTGLDYTVQLRDRGGHIYIVSAGDILIPTHAAVAFPTGTCITVVTDGTHSTHIKAVDSGVTTLVLSKTGPANTLTGVAVSADTYVTMLKVAANRWMIQVA